MGRCGIHFARKSSWTGHRRTPIVSAGEQVAVCLEHGLPGLTDRQEAHSVPRARSQRTTPLSEPTASSRLSRRIEGR